MDKREKVKQLIQSFYKQGDKLGWFEALYAAAQADPQIIPWADFAPNPHLLDWLKQQQLNDPGKSAILIGCGLGDDAEELAKRGFQVTAFDISSTAIQWCKKRFPDSSVDYQVANLLELPSSWQGQFDLVVEAYTLQALPRELKMQAIISVAKLVAPQGTLLVIARAKNAAEEIEGPPWPLTLQDLSEFEKAGLKKIAIEDFFDQEQPPVRRFCAEFVS